jgi:hypothetical protein
MKLRLPFMPTPQPEVPADVVDVYPERPDVHLASKEPEFGTAPLWRRILSPGHVHVARLEHEDSEAPVSALPKLLAAASVAAILLGIVLTLFSPVVAHLVGRVMTPKIPSISAPAADHITARKPLDAAGLSRMLLGATVSEKKGVISVNDLRSAINQGFREDVATLLDWPAAGSPWSTEGVITATVGDTVFYGVRLVAEAPHLPEPVWLGVRRTVAGKTAWFSVVDLTYPQLTYVPGTEGISHLDIPDALNGLLAAAGRSTAAQPAKK